MGRKSKFAAVMAALACWSGVAWSESPYTAPENSWISLSGSVVNARDDGFDLDYGKGIVTVELDDWDAYRESRGVLEGDKVTVYGKVDSDLFETTTIEAASVYVESLNTTFYASAADEETTAIYVASTPIIVPRAEVTGTVTLVNDKEFVVNTGDDRIIVDPGDMPYDPLDDRGYQKIRVGDRVKVMGEFDRELFQGRELRADTIITLVRDRR